MEMKHLENELEKSVGEIIIDLQREIRELKEENKKLKEKVRFLEECLDRKEKLNEKYRKEIEESYVYDAKQVRDVC